MPPTDNNLTSALLRVMRSRRSSLAPDISSVSDHNMADLRQREVQFSDFEAVAKLKSESGLSSDSLENWQRLWRYSPAVFAAKSPPSMGWVLEVDSRVVGYLGSIPLLYHYGDRPLLVATASGFAVEPTYRAFSIGLMASFYRQENVDLFLNTSAIESVGKMVRAFQAEPLPQRDYDTVLFWVLDDRQFLHAVAKKFGVNSTIDAVGGILGSLALRTEKVLRRRHPRHNPGRYRITETSVAEIGSDFTEVWQRKIAEKPRLLADRDQRHLRWHFTIPGSQQVTRVLRCEDQGCLIGYGVVQFGTQDETGLRTCLLADMLVPNDEPEVVKSLVARAYDLAKESGCHVFEVLGFPWNLRQALLQWNPYSRKYPACPFYFKAKDRALHGILKNEDVWYASPFDGDTTLMR
jgi:hypothetical protein